MLHHPCYGDPRFTFSDVERAVIREVVTRDHFTRFSALADTALRRREVATLERLEAKYRAPQQTERPAESTSASPAEPSASPVLSEKPLKQASLF